MLSFNGQGSTACEGVRCLIVGAMSSQQRLVEQDWQIPFVHSDKKKKYIMQARQMLAARKSAAKVSITHLLQ